MSNPPNQVVTEPVRIVEQPRRGPLGRLVKSAVQALAGLLLLPRLIVYAVHRRLVGH